MLRLLLRNLLLGLQQPVVLLLELIFQPAYLLVLFFRCSFPFAGEASGCECNPVLQS